MKDILKYGLIGIGAYLLGRQFCWWGCVADTTTPPTDAGKTPVTTTPPTPSLKDKVIAAAGGAAAKFNADQWGWFFASVAGHPAPAPESYGIAPVGQAGRDATFTGAEWWAKVTAGGVTLSGFVPFGRLQ